MDLGNFSVKTMNEVDFITNFRELGGKNYKMESEYAVFDPKYNKGTHTFYRYVFIIY